MANIGFRDRETALLLKQIAAERRLRPHISTRIEQEDYPFGEGGGGAAVIAFRLGPGLFGSPATVLGYWNCYDPAAPTGDPPTTPDVIVIDPAGAFPGVDENDVGYAILAKRSDADDTQKGKWIVQYCTESYDDNHPDPPDPPDPSDNVTVVTGISWNGSEIVATKTTVNLAGSGGGTPAGQDTIGTTACP